MPEGIFFSISVFPTSGWQLRCGGVCSVALYHCLVSTNVIYPVILSISKALPHCVLILFYKRFIRFCSFMLPFKTAAGNTQVWPLVTDESRSSDKQHRIDNGVTCHGLQITLGPVHASIEWGPIIASLDWAFLWRYAHIIVLYLFVSSKKLGHNWKKIKRD